MSEADRLLHNLLEAGDVVGRDDAGRVVIVLAIEPRDFNQLVTFGAVEVESEDGGECELPDVAPCWAWEAAQKFFGLPHCKQGRRRRLLSVLAFNILHAETPSARLRSRHAETRPRCASAQGMAMTPL